MSRITGGNNTFFWLYALQINLEIHTVGSHNKTETILQMNQFLFFRGKPGNSYKNTFLFYKKITKVVLSDQYNVWVVSNALENYSFFFIRKSWFSRLFFYMSLALWEWIYMFWSLWPMIENTRLPHTLHVQLKCMKMQQEILSFSNMKREHQDKCIKKNSFIAKSLP